MGERKVHMAQQWDSETGFDRSDYYYSACGKECPGEGTMNAAKVTCNNCLRAMKRKDLNAKHE